MTARFKVIDANFVAVGNDSKIYFHKKDSKKIVLVSCTNWGVNWQKIAFGNGRYVAIGYSYNNGYITTSNDGINWTTPQEMKWKEGENSTVRWDVVIFANGKFVLLDGEYGCSATSIDGISWTIYRGNSQHYTWKSITYGDGKFVAVGTANMSNAYSTMSTDGINWTTSIRVGLILNLDCVAYGNGVFAAGVNNDILSSSDGLNWDFRSEYYYSKDMIFGEDRFITVGESEFTTSFDGINWGVKSNTSISHKSLIPITWHSIRYGNAQFVAVGRYSNSQYVTISDDGINWADDEILKVESGQALNMQINDICVMP